VFREEKQTIRHLINVYEVECGVVYCVMLPDLSHAAKILGQTPRWKKRITDIF
jgi:hypothetical protein